MTTALLAGGTLTANPDDRVVTGRLYSFNEEGRTNLGRLKVGKGAFKIPADLSLMYLAQGHDKPVKGIGTGLYAQETDDGLYAAWRIAEGAEGDALLAAWRSGDPATPRALSVEVDEVKIRGGVAIGGVLHGASVVPAGAFASATLLAADTDEPAGYASPVESKSTYAETFVDENGVTWQRVSTTTTTTDTTKVDEPDEPVDEDTDTEETEMPVPNTLTAAKSGGAPAGTARPRIPTAREVIAAIGASARGTSTEDHKTLLAALNNINGTGNSTGTADNPFAAGVMQPDWLGQLYQGVAYVRQYAGLGKLGNDISYAGKKGYKLHRGTQAAPVDSYASTGSYNGQGAAIASGKAWTETFASTLHQWAIGNGIERALVDLRGGEEVIESFFKLYIEDALIWSDELALAEWVSLAGEAVAPVDLEAVYGADSPLIGKYPPAAAMLVQGILAVKAKKSDNRRDVPTFAILNDKAAEQLAYTPFESVLEQFKFNLSTDLQGDMEELQLVTGDVGIDDTPAVIVGAKYAAEFDEPAGGPLQINATDVANGLVDRGIHGYFQTFDVRPEAVVLVGEADEAAEA